MLVLSRHVDERIMIGDDIVITVTRISHDKVWLGIDAPRAVPVHRDEVVARIAARQIGPRPVPPPERPGADPRD